MYCIIFNVILKIIKKTEAYVMQEETSIDMKDYLYIVKKRITLITTITLICTLVSGVLSFFVIKPTYEAKTSIIVSKQNTDTSKNQDSYSDVMMLQNLIKTYSEIAKLRSVAQTAVTKYNLDITPEKLQSRVKVTPETGTQILTIAIDDGTAEGATQKVNAVADAFITQAQQLLPTGTVKIMDKAEVPKSPIKPKKTLNVAIAFFLGLMISLGTSFVLEYMDSTIRDERDVEKYLNIPVIGVIPKHM